MKFFFLDFVGRGRSMARWKGLEKTNFFIAHRGSRKWVLWAGRKGDIRFKLERGECIFLRPSGDLIFLKLNYHVGTLYKNGGNIKLASGV